MLRGLKSTWACAGQAALTQVAWNLLFLICNEVNTHKPTRDHGEATSTLSNSKGRISMCKGVSHGAIRGSHHVVIVPSSVRLQQ
jgi:hypothetical protein